MTQCCRACILAVLASSLFWGCSGSDEERSDDSHGTGTGESDDPPPPPDACLVLAGVYTVKLAEVQACDPAEEDPCIGAGLLVDRCGCQTTINKQSSPAGLKTLLDVIRESDGGQCFPSKFSCGAVCRPVTTPACLPADENDASVGICNWVLE